MATVLVQNADRMMTAASPRNRGIHLTFADGCSGVIPFGDLPEIGDRSNLESIEIPNPYEIVLKNTQGETVEIPWDFARHYCDPSYRPRVEALAATGRQSIGDRIRRLREAAAMTQGELASRAGIGRVTLVRIENGAQSPRYETLVALSQALARPLPELLTGQ
ncbi:MAG: helix-turn-helix transcriptional regulator [Dehalococcoidia bacterium]|nr:helix-turn-helix transcriptional regulator [Dehalococcoidia bacterium]